MGRRCRTESQDKKRRVLAAKTGPRSRSFTGVADRQNWERKVTQKTAFSPLPLLFCPS